MVGDGVDVTIVASGIVDRTNSGELGRELERAAGAANTVVVDFREADFIDTAVLQYLLRTAKALLRRGKRLRVMVSEGSHPLHVLQVVGFAELMDVVAGPAAGRGGSGWHEMN